MPPHQSRVAALLIRQYGGHYRLLNNSYGRLRRSHGTDSAGGGSGSGSGSGGTKRVVPSANAARGPVTWGGLVVSTVVAGAFVTYYQVRNEGYDASMNRSLT